MTGLDWSYEFLCNAIPILTYHSSSPMSAAELNPDINRLLTTWPGSSVCGVGRHAVVLSLTSKLVAKVSLKPGGPHVRHEQSIFEVLNQVLSPYIVQTFLHRPDITLMEHANDRTLCERVSMPNRSHLIPQWMLQLAEAAAWVEWHGLVHGDLNPRDILFDRDQLKLVDFDHALKIGVDLDVGQEPYARRRKSGEPGGDYGVAGPRTEQFALGSIFWFMTRGNELYHELDRPEKVDRLVNGQFPATDAHDPIDCIISDCWQGKFQSMADLLGRVRGIRS